MRDVEKWKNGLLVLPDSLFFNIIRNYLGELPTPFNKHELIQDLVRFVNRRETKRRMLLFITPKEKLILSGIAALENPTLDMLYFLLVRDFGYLEMNERLLNLESRLLIYHFDAGGESRMSLNPLLAGDIQRGPGAIGNLIRLYPVKKRRRDSPWLQDALLLGFLSYLLDEPSLFKLNGEWRRKGLQDVSRLFPDLAERRDRLNLLVSSLLRLSLVTRTAQGLAVDWTRWAGLTALDGTARRLLLWSAAVSPPSGSREPEIRSGGADGLQKAGALLSSFLRSIPADRAVSREDAGRIYILLSACRSTTYPGRQDVVRFVEGLEGLGLLLSNGGDRVVPSGWAAGGIPPEAAVVVQPNYEITVPQELDLAEGLPIARAARIRRFDRHSRFEIDRGSFQRHLDCGGNSTELIDRLRRLSGHPVPQNVLFSLRTWEKEYRKLQLFDGIVLVADEDREYLLEHSRLLKDFIYRKLAPGVYLMPRERMEMWKRALVRAGLEHVPEVKSADVAETEPEAPTLFPAETAESPPLEIGEPDDGGDPEALEKELLDALARRTGSLDESDVDDIRRRIGERLILFQRQLKPLRREAEREEARGLNYAGKVRIVERAIHEAGLVEVIERTDSGAPRRLSVEPERLEKRGSDLVLIGRRLPESREVAIRVRKIGVVRRLRKNLR